MRFALVLAAALALSGCNPFNLSGSSSGPRPAPLAALERPQEVRVLWTARIGSSDRFSFTPAPVGDAVFAAGRDGTVVRLDAATGTERWRASTERRLSGGVGADARTVAVATEEGVV